MSRSPMHHPERVLCTRLVVGVSVNVNSPTVCEWIQDGLDGGWLNVLLTEAGEVVVSPRTGPRPAATRSGVSVP